MTRKKTAEAFFRLPQYLFTHGNRMFTNRAFYCFAIFLAFLYKNAGIPAQS